MSLALIAMLVPIFVQPQSVVLTAKIFDPMQNTRQKKKLVVEKDTDAVTDNSAELNVFGRQTTQCTARSGCSQAGKSATGDHKTMNGQHSCDQLS